MTDASIDTDRTLLVICNAYPSGNDLYRNGFIHRRVKGYQESGLQVKVFYNHEPVTDAYQYTFDGVDVTVGNGEALFNLVSQSPFLGYLVHFAELTRIEPLERAQVSAPVIIWIHGFEAEGWYRRWFNFIDSSAEIRAALDKKETYYKGQNAFLAQLVNEPRLNYSFVNVSEWFKDNIVEPDLDVEFGEENSTVIPNLIDEEIFVKSTKDPSLRKNILSIRPYASYKYANDLSVKAILELSTRPYFDDLQFTICGQGKYFADTVAPLRAFKNVTLRNEFFTQEEVKELHRTHGIFLSPTRFDSQGVSMCEAISSGLVSISSDVAAVPEFITHGKTGLLAPAENHDVLARSIEELYFDEELFQKISNDGADHMHLQCGRRATIGKEIAFINSRIEAVNG